MRTLPAAAVRLVWLVVRREPQARLSKGARRQVAEVGEVTTTALVLLVAQVVRLEEAVVALVAALRQAAWVAQAVEAK